MSTDKSFNDAVRDVTEIMQFENWLRFYFVEDREGTLYVNVPAEAYAKIQELHPNYEDLVELFNNQAIDYESTMEKLCRFVVSKLDGPVYRSGLVTTVFDSDELKMEMQLFYTWVQGHEAQLDQTFLPFTTWLELLGEWKNSPEVRAYFENVRQQAANGGGGEEGPVQ